MAQAHYYNVPHGWVLFKASNMGLRNEYDRWWHIDTEQAYFDEPNLQGDISMLSWADLTQDAMFTMYVSYPRHLALPRGA